MIKENVKIMNWRNGFLLSLVSYILYLIIWLILDDETANQLPGMATVDYVVDFLLCMLFTYISLGFSYLVFKILPFRTSYVWVIVYASCLLTLNNLVVENPLKVVPLIHSNLTPVKFSHSPFCLFLFSSYSSCPLCRVLH